MGTGNGSKQFADDQSVLLKSLREQQTCVKEGSLAWHELENKINQIIAQRYLQMLNR